MAIDKEEKKDDEKGGVNPVIVKLVKELEEEINEEIDYEDFDITEEEIEDKKAYS